MCFPSLLKTRCLLTSLNNISIRTIWQKLGSAQVSQTDDWLTDWHTIYLPFWFWFLVLVLRTPSVQFYHRVECRLSACWVHIECMLSACRVHVRCNLQSMLGTYMQWPHDHLYFTSVEGKFVNGEGCHTGVHVSWNVQNTNLCLRC